MRTRRPGGQRDGCADGLRCGVAEGEGFEPPDGLPHLLISSQVPLTTQPPFPPAREMNQAAGPEASPAFNRLAAETAGRKSGSRPEVSIDGPAREPDLLQVPLASRAPFPTFCPHQYATSDRAPRRLVVSVRNPGH